MSDFLTHLAARAIAQPTLRPRTRMRFEPAAAAETVAVWPERRGGLQPPESPESPAEVRAAARRPDENDPGTPRVETREIVRTEHRVRIEPRVEREVHRIIEPRVRTRDRVIREREHDLVNTITPSKPVAPHRFDEEPPRIASASRDEQQDDEPREPVRATTSSQSPTTRRSQPPSALPAASQHDPDIHITIGRVEVRAVAPQPAARRTPQRSSVMTLDDYVAKRKGRERR
ncbi:MAG TPA: hypothetical protein VN181_12030 [Thermoanaerobaculia bacterium]|nr:hypothetical protein [Thermoanaerobaculia bacterium]